MVTSNAYAGEPYMMNSCLQEAVMLWIIFKSFVVSKVWKKGNGEHKFWIQFYITQHQIKDFVLSCNQSDVIVDTKGVDKEE